jgi:molybdopterin-guanine dinucleotide biosynthesis protein A
MGVEASDGAPIVGVTGVVLAGGASRRMGSDKAALLLGGEPLLRRAVGRLRQALAEVVVVGAPTLAPLVPETRIIADEWPGRGPLGALATALRATDAEWVLLVACDMPFTQPALIRELARMALAAHTADVGVALRGPRGLEPLHAAYRRACLSLALERLASDDASLQGLLAALPVREIASAVARRLDPAGLSAFNANTPDEWQRALRLAEERGFS